MLLATIVVLYLVGIPFGIGVLGPKFNKFDWTFALIIGLCSWIGVALFLGVTFAIWLAMHLYDAGMWFSNAIDRILNY